MQCEFESQVIGATRKNAITDQLRAHINSCLSCQATEQLTLSFRALASDTNSLVPSPPDPSLLWREVYISPEPVRSNTILYLITAAVLAVTMTGGYFIYHAFFDRGAESSVSITRLPLAGSPFPFDSGLVFLLLAIALVLFLPQIGPSKPKNYTSTMVSL